MEKLFELIEKLQNKADSLKESIEEHEEVFGDYVDPMDASGGNFDDAYNMGIEHGEMFKEYEVVNKILKELVKIVESNE